MFCSNCGNEISSSAKFCNKCGTKVNVNKEVIDENKKQIKNEELDPKLINNTQPTIMAANTNNSKPSPSAYTYKDGKNNGFLFKHSKVITIVTLIVIAAGFFAYKSLPAFNKQNAKTTQSKALAATNKALTSSDSALKSMKAMDDTQLKKFTYDAQFDKNGVAVACIIKSTQDNNGTILAKVKVTNANKSKTIYVAYTDLSLIDENGKVYPADNYTFGMDNQLPSTTIAGGNYAEGYVVFKVPTNKNRFVLKYDYDQASKSCIYKPILVEPWGVNDSGSKQATSTQNTSSSSSAASNTSAKSQYINGSDVKITRKTDNIIEVSMKVSIGKSFVGTLYADKFVAKAANVNAAKAYSGLFTDSPDAKTSTVVKQDRIDPTAGDNYYVLLFFNVPKDAGDDFKIYYSYVGDLVPLGN